MQTNVRPQQRTSRITRALAVMAIVASVLVTSAPFAQPNAEAQVAGTESLEVWGISGGIVPNAKTWQFRQSTTNADQLGTAQAADPSLDDSSWATRELRWKEVPYPGPFVANHFRKDFDLSDLDVDLFQIVGMQVSIQYDDSAIMYLNGVEVYRSIRGNLDPTYADYPLSTDLPRTVNIPYGGAEEHYVQIPNINNSNTCEKTGPLCPTSPYGGPDVPAIPASLLVDGVNTWAITTWNQNSINPATGAVGGSGDSSLNHTFELLIDENAVEPNAIFINEVVASNSDSYEVEIDGALETPDWFELVNISNADVNIGGWTISDATASWEFPDTAVVPANGHLVVVANDGDDTTSTPLQTNFKLSSSGDALKLTNESGIVADDYGVMPPQFTDNSFGRPADDVTAAPTYLDTATAGPVNFVNSVAGNGYVPILRPFASRLYNQGETVTQQVNAFDPDGDTLTYSMSPMPPGITMDSSGAITGTAITVGTFPTTITVTDSDNDSESQDVNWTVLPPAPGASPLVMNEYNAVAGDRELLIGGPVGNGGDWFEFLVVEDDLDLRGYTMDFYDRKGDDDGLRYAASVTFADDVRLASAPAGTIVTISEDLPTDVNFDGVTDWHINLQIDNTAQGEFFAAPDPNSDAKGVFNSTRSGQVVVIYDADGTLVTAASGESEAWDDGAGGVSGGEVMNLCVSPGAGYTLDPLTDYQDNGGPSSFGEPNTCVFPDPADPFNTLTFSQDLSSLRSSANFGAGSGDTNCDGVLNVFDAVNVSQFFVGIRNDSGPCFFNQGGPGFDMYAMGGEVTGDGAVNTFDAVLISQCVANLQNALCP